MKELPSLINQFIQAKQLEVTSPKSVTDMRYFMKLIGDGLMTLFPDVEPDQLTTLQLRSLLEWWDQDRSGRKLKKATIKKAVMYLKYLFRWLHDERLIPQNASSTLRYRPRAKYAPTARIPETDIRKLIQAADGDMYLDTLARLTIRLLLDTGVRAQEICELKPSEVQPLQGRLNLSVGKGGKVAPLGFGSRTQHALKDYLRARQDLPEQIDPHLLLNSQGRKMTPRNLDRLLKHYSKLAGTSPVSAHQFRVTFAVEQFLNGASLIAVQTALRHSSIDMTVRYLRLAEQERHALACAMTSVVDRFANEDEGVQRQEANSAMADLGMI